MYHHEGADVLKQVAQKNCGCPIPGSFHGQAGWGPLQPDLWKVSLPMARKLELDDFSGPFQLKPSCDSIKMTLLKSLCYLY